MLKEILELSDPLKGQQTDFRNLGCGLHLLAATLKFNIFGITLVL
jgi:hypothetical protein